MDFVKSLANILCYRGKKRPHTAAAQWIGDADAEIKIKTSSQQEAVVHMWVAWLCAISGIVICSTIIIEIYVCLCYCLTFPLSFFNQKTTRKKYKKILHVPKTKKKYRWTATMWAKWRTIKEQAKAINDMARHRSDCSLTWNCSRNRS